MLYVTISITGRTLGRGEGSSARETCSCDNRVTCGYTDVFQVISRHRPRQQAPGNDRLLVNVKRFQLRQNSKKKLNIS